MRGWKWHINKNCKYKKLTTNSVSKVILHYKMRKSKKKTCSLCQFWHQCSLETMLIMGTDKQHQVSQTDEQLEVHQNRWCCPLVLLPEFWLHTTKKQNQQLEVFYPHFYCNVISHICWNRINYKLHFTQLKYPIVTELHVNVGKPSYWLILFCAEINYI